MPRYIQLSHKEKHINRILVQKGSKNSYRLGSQIDKVEIGISSPFVSRDHAQIIVDLNGIVYLIDRESTNGTFLNGKQLKPNTPYLVDVGDNVIIGAKSTVQMSIIEVGDEPQPPPQEGLLARLKRNRKLSIGRDAKADIQIDSPSASRKHAILSISPKGEIVLQDLNSTNGTFVNGQRIKGSQIITSNAKILIGRTLLRLKDNTQFDLNHEIAIRTHGISKRFRNGKVGLHKTNLSIPSGSLVAIMGPSGCGKSTLLKCLTGESPSTQGKVELWGQELTQNYAYLKTQIGFVPQEDIVHKQLTVYQSLYFAAKLRLAKPTPDRIDAKIKQVLNKLNISGIRDSSISKISGGQRKRVSIAVELLNDPQILFLDEPTSPLDPQTIAEFMGILQGLAKDKGTTIIMVTHKPEDLAYMDSVMFLAENGFPCYDGPADQFKQYFEVDTAVEVYKNITGPKATLWTRKFTKNHPPDHSVSPPPVRKKRPKPDSDKPLMQQLYWLSARYLRIKLNDLFNVMILIGQAPIIAGLICIIFDEIGASVPFLITLSAIWFGTSNAAREIVGETSIYQRERMFNLKIGPYIFSKILVLALFGLIQACLLSGIVYFRFEQTTPPWNDVGTTILWVWVLTINATVMGLLVSALANSVEKVMTIVPLILIPQVMLAGVITPINNKFVELLSYIAPTRWGNEGLTLIQGRLKGLGGMTENAKDILERSFHNEYGDSLFPGSAYTLELDFTMLLIHTTIMLTILAFAMRRKDSLR